MPETAVKTSVCDICGFEVRPESLFCYNCGGSVSEPGLDGRLEVAEKVDASGMQDAEASANGNTSGTKFDPAARRAERAQKRNVRASNRQPVEIVWEPATGVGWPFIVGSTVFIIIALALFLAAYYVR